MCVIKFRQLECYLLFVFHFYFSCKQKRNANDATIRKLRIVVLIIVEKINNLLDVQNYKYNILICPV